MHFLPEGTPFIPDHQYPETKADYDRLKALKDEQIVFERYCTENPCKLVGYELKYTDGHIIKVGNTNAEKYYTKKFDKKIRKIELGGIENTG